MTVERVSSLLTID